MMKNPALKVVGHVTWVVTGLYALNAMTSMHGVDLFGWGPLAGMKCTVAYVVGVCGLVSLVFWGMALSCGRDGARSC